jgi:hypothetical protein
LAAAQKVNWNLSAAVMPVPPYGSLDIPGSDTTSKLIVNQPNGNTEVAITGVMNGLTPNTEYTVFISNGYQKYVPASIAANWVASFSFDGVNVVSAYDIDLTSGTATYPAGSPGPYPYTSSGIVYSFIGNTFNLTSTYDPVADPAAAGCVTHMSGTIAPNGSISGTWDDNYPNAAGSRSGFWTAPVGTAVQASGSTGWTGFFNTQQAFTFTTDAYGAGSWHVNLKDADLPAGPASGTCQRDHLQPLRLDQRWWHDSYQRHFHNHKRLGVSRPKS